MPTSPTLFSPLALGPLTLPNRLVMAPMTRSRAGAGLTAGALQARYYAQRASAGLIVSEGTQVSEQGQGYVHTPGIYSDAQRDGWRVVTDAVHAAGGRIFAQLWHVGRVSHASFQPGGGAPVAPSALPIPGETYTPEGLRPFTPPRALELSEIAGVVAQFAHGAEVARAAGFDGVEIHGSNGYLIDQFLKDGSNRRTDAYGGGIARRVRLLLEVVEAVAGVWGPARVGVRVNPFTTANDVSDSDPPALFSRVASELDARQVGYLHVTEPVAGRGVREGPRLTPDLRRLYRGVLIGNGGYDRVLADAALARGELDAVAFGVPFLANPDLVRRYATGAPLNPPDVATFYAGGERGYTDYPTLPVSA